MTLYHGGKARYGEEIASIIYLVVQQEVEKGFVLRGYCEPFVGMCGVYRHIPELFGGRIQYLAGDINGSVIKMWQSLQNGWKPPIRCSKTKFNELKGNGKESAEKGYLGHICSFRGLYFSSYYARPLKNKRKQIENIAHTLTNVKFTSGDYEQFSALRGYVIYCDPPYSTGSYFYDENHQQRKFDERRFYNWIEKMSQYNIIFLSEKRDLPFETLAQFKNSERLYFI